MKNHIFFTLFFLILNSSVNSQFMLNGGFEQYNNDFTHPNDINRANDWHIMFNSPDLYHQELAPNTNTFSYAGQGVSRFGLETVQNSEYFYGKTTELSATVKYILSFYVRSDVPNYLQMGIKIVKDEPNSYLYPYPPGTITHDSQAAVEFINNPNNSADIIFTSIGTNYQKVSYCFTPDEYGNYYVIFGTFISQMPPDPSDGNIFWVDNVNISYATIEQQNVESNLVLTSTALCTQNTLLIDGSSSQFETEHQWEIFKLVNNQPTLVYSGNNEQGNAGVFNVTTAFSSVGYQPLPGDCYRVQLKVVNGCTDIDQLDFCYEDLNVDFLNVPAAVCEGTPTDISVTGDDNWTYTWSNGDSGEGMKTTSVIPVFPSSQYTVTVTSPSGCSQINTITLNVHSNNNTAPTLNGINNSGEYTAYAHAGEEICFDIPSFDNANEVVIMSNNSNLIFGSSFLNNNQPQSTGTFCWTPENNTQGSYYFDVTVTDNNVCGNFLSSTYTFQINVVCENCHVCISFDGDTPTNAQLPSTVNAGNCILAGLDNPVFVGVDNSVYFQAGNYIELGPAFDTQDGLFEAVIDPVTCLTGCANCCDNFDGFTIDFPFTDVFTPNGNGVNDIFYFRDDDNPTCAFNATKFEFRVFHNWGPLLYYLEGSNLRPDICCPFIAPTNDTPSSIYWDGRVNVGFGVGNMVNAGTYTWTLKLFNCDNSELFHGFLDVWDPQGIEQSNEVENQINRTDVSNNIESQVNFTDSLNNELIIYPNPSSNKLYIKSTRDIEQVQFYDNTGKMIFSKMNFFNQPINISNLADGMYFIKIINKDKNIMTKSFLKQ